MASDEATRTADPGPVPPVAPAHPVTIEQLGRTRTDPYGWMRDANWQAVLRDPSVLRADIRTHLEAENAYTRSVLAGTASLQEAILAEMVGRIRQDDSSVPDPDGAFDYAIRFEAGAQQPLHVRTPRGGGPETVLLDREAMRKESAYLAIASAGHSADHTLYAWAEDRQGSEVYRILVRRIADGALLGAPVESAAGSFALTPDAAHLFWVWRDDNGRPSRVYRRPVGGDATDDALVHDETDPGLFVGVELSRSGRFVVISIGNQETSEARVIASDRPLDAPRALAPREPGLRYEIDHWGDRFVIRTNADGAIDFKLATAPEEAADRSAWRDLVPHRAGHFVTGMIAYRDFLVRAERVDANDRIVIMDRTGAERPIAAEAPAYALSLVGGHEYATDRLRYAYESPAQPRQVFDLDMRSGERTLRKTQDVPSGHDAGDYVVERIEAVAADGARVPITLLCRRDGQAGPRPVLLYGYGAYGIPMQPGFSIRSLSLVDRGWVWAIAHVRGGSEKGWGWFLDGRRESKTNSFTDFIACAERLIETGRTEAGRIVAHGGSAGGMLMGAVLNLRPDLWAGVAAAVPFVDVLNTMSDASLPLTPPEWPEWGNPLEDPQAYDRIAAYSPYDRVAELDYPPVLALGGLSDPRVTYWEPAKWVARLRAATTGAAPILLRINMQAGHGGASGRFEYLKEPAMVQAFALWALERASRPG